MRSWERSRGGWCGLCCEPISEGDPVLIVTFRLSDAKLRRCAACADEPVPKDLPPLPQKPIHEPLLKKWASVSRLAHDWRQKRSDP